MPHCDTENPVVRKAQAVHLSTTKDTKIEWQHVLFSLRELRALRGDIKPVRVQIDLAIDAC